MRTYANLSKLSTILGFPPDGKRLGKVLAKVGIREPRGMPSLDSKQRYIAKKGNGNCWLYDVDAVTVRVMGGYLSPCAAQEAEAIATELGAIDDAFSMSCSTSELLVLGDRWETALSSMRPEHYARVNGILRRDGFDIRIDLETGDVVLPGDREREDVA